MKRFRSRSFAIRAKGPLACFTDPAYRQERFSYPIPTPPALEGVVKAIVWRKGLRVQIDQICILSPIRRLAIRRNELKEISGREFEGDNHTQRLTSALRDVDYRIEFRYVLEDPEGDTGLICKVQEMFERYMNRGRQYHQPFLGMREFSADVRWATPEDPKPIQASQTFGRMVYGYIWGDDVRDVILDYEAVMTNGVVVVPPFEQILKSHTKGVADAT